MGFEQSVSPAQLRTDIEPVVRSLCSEISQDILTANNGAPSAVFLVGGGSKLSGMCGYMAECLSLDAKRVAIGGNNFMMHVSAPDLNITGPEYATPLGIAISAGLNLISDSFSILLNGSKAKLFRSRKLTVLDVLMMNGYSYNNLISRSGRSMIVELNGENHIFYGGHPDVAKIKINGVEAAVSTLVNAGDEIQFEPAVPGKDAQPLLYDVVPFTDPGSVFFHDAEYSIGTYATVNGKPASPEQELNHHDCVKTTQITTLSDLLRDCGENTDRTYLVNGRPVELDTVLADGDNITDAPLGKSAVHEPEVPIQQIPDFIADIPEVHKEQLPLSEIPQPQQAAFQETESLPARFQEPVEQEAAAEEIQPVAVHLTLNRDSLALPAKPDGTPYYLVDMLNLVDMDLTKPEGRRIIIKVNGQDAAYLQMLADGDEIDIHWEGTSDLLR